MDRAMPQMIPNMAMVTKSTDKFSYRSARIKVDGEILKYDPGNSMDVGCLVMSQCLDEVNNYFEIKILDGGIACCISVGLVPFNHSLNAQPGWNHNTVGYHADDGRLFQKLPNDGSGGLGKPFGPRCKVGDKMGCGIRKCKKPLEEDDIAFGGPRCKLEVYFTLNGNEVGATEMVVPDHVDGLHPCVGMHSDGESAQLTVIPGSSSAQRDVVYDDFMHVDDTEEEWIKVHDVRVNGQMVEYAGNGMNIHDVGLAQAKTPLSTRNHYFEIEILEPGQHCYIAIGLIHKNYPLHRHPGWNVGSIAYHADDGKIFLGRGQGVPFGPRCARGDVMGCGIQFPCEYISPLPASSDDDDADDDEDDYNYKPGQPGPDARPAPMPFYIDLMDEPDPLELQDDLESGDEDDFLWPQYDKFDDLLWGPRGDGEEPMPMDFVLEPGMGRANLDRLFDVADPLRRGGAIRDRAYMRGGLRGGVRGGVRGPHHPIYGGKDKSIMVKVFFTRNGYMIGHKEVTMPKDGFYPAIGMLSPNEKVKVELHPLSGCKGNSPIDVRTRLPPRGPDVLPG